MEQYPKIYGLDTVGLSLLFDEQGFERTVMEPAVVSTGLPYQGDWYVDQNNMVRFHIQRDEEKEYIRWLNHTSLSFSISRDGASVPWTIDYSILIKCFTVPLSENR